MTVIYACLLVPNNHTFNRVKYLFEGAKVTVYYLYVLLRNTFLNRQSIEARLIKILNAEYLLNTK